MIDTSNKKQHLLFALVFLFSMILSSVPLLSSGTHSGHDLGFHLYRIVSLSDALSKGAFPVRIYPERFNNYGYGSPLFYCDFFLLIPAVLHNAFSLDITTCWKVLMFLLNLATFFTAYYSYRFLSGSANIGLAATFLYTLSTYRLLDIYTRAAIGESCALVFFPLVFCGLVQVLREHPSGWLTLTVGYTGILLSHTLSFLYRLVRTIRISSGLPFHLRTSSTCCWKERRPVRPTKVFFPSLPVTASPRLPAF